MIQYWAKNLKLPFAAKCTAPALSEPNANPQRQPLPNQAPTPKIKSPGSPHSKKQTLL
jgi:hypothetical protein